MAKWLDKYEQGGLVLKKKTKDNYGKKPNVNDVKVSAGPGFEGDGYTAQNWKSPAWGGQFAMGGALPGAVGFTYARTAGSAPANGKYTKKTKASAQDGTQTPKVNSEGKKLLYPKTIDPAFKDVYEGELELFDPKDFDSVKKQIGDYMTSNTYLKRLNNFIPDKRFANRVQLSRASALLNAKLLADKPDDGHYNPVAYAGIPAHSIQIRPSDTSSTVTHELAHSIFREQLSDNPNSTTGALGLNPAEMAAVLKNLNRENIYKTYTAKKEGWEHPLAYYDEHYDTRGGRRERDAVNETYADLTSVRKLLNDNGITKKFGDDITPEMWKKASENPKINKVPTFKRMRIKYKDDDIIKMNNSVAQNDNDNLIPIAQDGTTIDPNDVLPKGYPRTITKDVNANYDPFKNLWSGVDPKEITRRLEINPVFKQAALDAKVMSKKEFKNKYKDDKLVEGDSYAAFKEYDPKLYDFTIQRLKNEQEAYNNWTKSKQQFIEDKANKESFIGAYNTKKTEADEYVAKMSKKYGYTPGEDTSAHRAIVNKMINEANEAINTGIGYPLPNNPESEMTCINGICTIASNAGVDFSPLKGLTGVQKDSEGRYIPQFNPTFVQNDNYKKAGFRKLNPDEQPEAGDLAQYGDDGRLHHMELVLERTPQGMVTFNNYQQTKESKPGAGKADRPFKKGSNQASQFATTDYYRLDPTIEEKIESKDPEYLKKIEGKKKFESSDEAKAYKDYENYLKSNEETYNQYKSYLDKLPKKQNGGEMSFYQNGLDFKPKSISKNGSVIKDDRGQWAHPGEVTEIGSNDITMQGVDYPVLGISDTGDTQMMQPGEDYKFDGEKVTEFPMMEKGGWLDKFDDKAQEGKDIPKGYTLPTVTVTSRRFNKYPHISNDNILSSKQLASEFTKRAQGEAEIAKRKELANRETVRAYDPEKEDESLLSRAYHIAVNPMTALSYKVKGRDIPDHFERSPDRNILEYATNVINPFSLVDAAANVPGNIKRGEFLQAALNTASILPALSEFRGASYKNIYKYIPYTEKLTGKTRRQIFGDPAYESFLKHGPTTQPERPVASQQAQWLKFNREASPVYNTGTGENMQIAGTTLFDNNGLRIEADYPFAYFSEGSPWYGPKGSARMAEDLGVERIIVPKEGANLELYPAGESSIIMNPKELTKETINSYAGRRSVLSPFGEAFNPEAFDVYKGKPHWLKGYQKETPPINKNKIAGSVIEGDRKIFYNELGDEVGSIENFPDIDAQRNINWGSANEKMPEPKTIANPDYTDVGNKYLQNNDPFEDKRSTLKDIPISGGSTTKGPKEQMGFPNPLDFIDEIIPRLDPIKLLGVQGDIMDLSPLNLIPGYGKKLAGKNQTFRKFGNSIQDVIERQALSPKGGSKFRMGKDQIVKEGNWAARGEPNENYSGVFEATFDLNNPAANLSASGSANRNGVLMMDKAGNRLPDIPLTEPGMSFNRRLPFSTRYVPIDKQKLINNEFQFATMAPRLQSLAEKYGLGLGAATLMGKGAVDTYNKYTIDPVIDMAKKLELEKLGLNFKASKDTSSKKKQNGGWLNKYK